MPNNGSSFPKTYRAILSIDERTSLKGALYVITNKKQGQDKDLLVAYSPVPGVPIIWNRLMKNYRPG